MTDKIKLLSVLASFVLVFTLTLTSCSKSDYDGGGNNSGNKENNDDNDGSDIAPAFTLDTYDGNEVSFANYKDKVLVISFFGSSCPPCISVGPDIEARLHQEFMAKSDFAIIGIDQWNGNAAAVERFEESAGVTFPLGLKGSGVANAYGTTYDRLVLVNQGGTIAFRGKRIAANDLDEVVNMVKRLLN